MVQEQNLTEVLFMAGREKEDEDILTLLDTLNVMELNSFDGTAKVLEP